MLSLNLKLHSFSFDESIISTKGSIEVCILTFPDMQKKSSIIDTKDMYNSQSSFRIKYNENTNNIIICVTKKSYFAKDKLIAAGCINSKEIDENNNNSLKIDLYEPVQQSGNMKRRIIGRVKVNFTLKEIFTNENYELNTDETEQRTSSSKLNYLLNRNKKDSLYIFN